MEKITKRLPILWAPQEGAQRKFLPCPVWECLLHGNRGGGKTDVLLMDFAQGVGRGYGSDYRGLLLREATTELGDVIAKSEKWFPKMFPGSKYNAARKIWKFPDGESLWFNYARILSDYDQYHGHEYPWIGWEELTNQAISDIYLKLMSCNRCSNPLVPKKYRSTCNPSGPGHGWVKQRFIDAVQEGRILREEIELEYTDKKGSVVKETAIITRTHLFSDVNDNKILLNADPLYKAKMHQMTQDNEMLRKAWIHGSWDLVVGGFFADVWRPKIHILPAFKIPPSWTLIRSFDWGSSKPWCVTFAVEANGEQPDYVPEDFPYIPKGSIIVIREIYGWTGKVNEGDRSDTPAIVKRIKDVEETLLIEYGLRTQPGPADTSIYDVKDGSSTGKIMSDLQCYWTRAHKGAGSRVSGWALMRQMLGAAMRKDLEISHLYFLPQAHHHIRTLSLMQVDEKKTDDLNCFIKGTLIDTPRGKYPIENITVGDYVHTPIGIRKVLKSGISGISPVFSVTLSDNATLTGTKHHKVFIDGKGLTPLSLLEKGDVLCQRSLHTTEGLNLHPEMGDILSAITVIVTFLMEHNYCTEQNGRMYLEQFQKDMKYTTKTTSNLIQIFQILNLFMAQITQDTTSKRDMKLVGICTKYLKNGEALKKVKKSFDLIFSNALKILQKENLRAFIVVSCLLQNILQKDSVQSNAETAYPEKSIKNVPSVESFFGQKDTKQEKFRLVVTSVDGNLGEEEVYNLTTEQAHLYYANGCLVSNSDLEDHAMDSLRYLLARKMMQFKQQKVGI